MRLAGSSSIFFRKNSEASFDLLSAQYIITGQFKKLFKEGPSCIFWPLQSVVGRLSLRVQQLDVLCETKTKDNVFVQVGVAVQYRVVTESAYDAWYRLTSPTR